MPVKGKNSKRAWRDPDDAPEWTADQIARAELAIGGKVIRPAQGTLTNPRGRPKSANPKVLVHIRLDADVVEALKATGPGWQTRVNETLAKSVRARKRA